MNKTLCDTIPQTRNFVCNAYIFGDERHIHALVLIRRNVCVILRCIIFRVIRFYRYVSRSTDILLAELEIGRARISTARHN